VQKGPVLNYSKAVSSLLKGGSRREGSEEEGNEGLFHKEAKKGEKVKRKERKEERQERGLSSRGL